jgi:class 3 adenylate cyclase
MHYVPRVGALLKTSAPGESPTGEVTFLFSDIEGSTQSWEAHLEAMKAAVARHEQLLHGAIVRHAFYHWAGCALRSC